MPKNIFDYQDNSPNENSINQESDLQEKAKDLISKYKNYSQNQLMQELFSIVDKQKKEGLIDKEKLQVIRQTITPYLNSSQLEFLESLIEKLDV